MLFFNEKTCDSLNALRYTPQHLTIYHAGAGLRYWRKIMKRTVVLCATALLVIAAAVFAFG